jgi:hypothetical protein
MTPERLGTRAQLAWRPVLWTAVAACLLVPVLAMQVADEVAWTGLDFLAAATLSIGAGVAIEIVARTPFSPGLRIALGFMVAAGTVLLWAHGAVGVV